MREMYYRPDFPDGVEKVVRDVSAKVRNRQRPGGANDYSPEEYGAKELMRQISGRGQSEADGFVLKGENQKTEVLNLSDVVENSEALRWAAQEYFKLLLIDLQRCHQLKLGEYFLDHRKCPVDPDR